MRPAKVNRTAEQIPQPLGPVGQRFLSHFNHGWGFIFAPTPKIGERPHWQTESRYPLQPRNLWQQYLDQSILLGLRFDKQTSYLLIDIDRKSKLHPANSYLKYRELLDCLEEIGLCRPVPVQSSESGGLHIYYFFEEKQPSFLLASAIKQTVEAAGFKIKGGELEIFPNCKIYSSGSPSSFNAHRLPLQAGSYLLDDSLEPWSDDVEDLMDAADWSASGQDYSALSGAIALARFRKIVKFPHRQRNSIDQWRHDLEERISEGWTGYGQTNELLKDIACYGIVFRHLSGQALMDYIIITACQSPGYSQWCQHQHEIEERARAWGRCCEGFYTPYAGKPKRVNSYKEQFGAVEDNNIIELHPNEQRQQQTVERIRAIVAQLQTTGTFPERTSDRAQAIIAASKAQYGKGVSQTTLHKAIYLPLWHPDHQEKTEAKQHVNDCPESNTANLTAEKYPQLPDPWLEEAQPEKQTVQVTQLEEEKIYTPPQYMKVLYMSTAKALPPATPIAVLDQTEQTSISCNFSSSSSRDLKNLNLTNHKQNQCLDFRGAPLNENKQNLSNELTSNELALLDIATTTDSDVESICEKESQDENTPEAEASMATVTNLKFETENSLPIAVEGNEPPKMRAGGAEVAGVAGEEMPSVGGLMPLNSFMGFTPPAPSATPAPPASSQGRRSPEQQTFSPEEYRQAIRLKLQATAQARHWVKLYCTLEKLSLRPQERIKLEQLATRLLMLESPSLILQQEAQQWFSNNPSALEMAERMQQSKQKYRL